jgi:hypothetical protein
VSATLLRRVAALVAKLPGVDMPSVQVGIGSEMAFSMLAEQPEAKLWRAVYDDGSVIDSVKVRVGEVEFKAQTSRPATPEEKAALAHGESSRLLLDEEYECEVAT